MSRELDKVRGAIVPIEERDTGKNYPAPFSKPSGFFTFRYSSTEIFSQGGDLHVKMKQTRYEDGRLTSEECEGTLDRQACGRVVAEAQGYFLGQMANFVRLLYLPFAPRGRQREE